MRYLQSVKVEKLKKKRVRALDYQGQKEKGSYA